MASTGPNQNEIRAALEESRGAFLIVGGFSLFINLMMLTVPIYMLQVYDRVLTSRSEDTLIMLTVLALGLLALSAVVEAARQRLLVRVGVRLQDRLGSVVFDKLLLGRATTGAELGGQPLRDLETLRGFLTGQGLLAFFDAPWTPIYLALIFLLHPYLGILACAGALVLFGIALWGEIRTRSVLGRAAQSSGAAYNFVEAAARNSEAIRAMGMLSNLRRRWQRHDREGSEWQALASDRAGTLNALAKFIRPSLQIGILGLGAFLAIEQIISPGVMIAASIIMGRALAPVEMAIGSWRNFIGARAARRRLGELLQDPVPAVQRLALPRPKGELRVEELYVRPPGAEKPVVRRVSFALEAGMALGVIGPSAAGKSTLARALVGVWLPLSGHVRLDGAEISDWDPEDIGNHLGYVPQDVELFAGTVAENIARFGDIDSDEVVAAATAADAHRMILKLPQGYETELGEGASILSGGQRQRLALARALYRKPAFVVLDEPNSNLDAEGEAALRQTLVTLKEWETTVIIVSHRPSVLATVDKLLVLADGQIEMFGTRDEVMSKLPRPVPARKGRPAQVAAQLRSEGGGGHAQAR